LTRALPAASGQPRRTRVLAAAVGFAVFACYNANGREIGSYDSQPAKYTVYQLIAKRTFILDSVVARQPVLAERVGFATSRDGHVRSATSVVPAVMAWPPSELLAATGLVPLRLSNATIFAKAGASLIVTLAVVFVFFAARWRTSDGLAAAVALGFGLGTNAWPTASQTLWQHESVLAGLALAVMCLAPPAPRLNARRLWMSAAGLGVAGAARYQVAPAVLVLAISFVVRTRRPWSMVALLPVAVCAATMVALNLRWFGHPLGAMAAFEASIHPGVHAVSGALSATPWIGAVGLLLSPSRGLLVFSPVVLVALAAAGAVRREGWGGDLRWCVLAAGAQFGAYAFYSVWWGGHTYGPRYMIDVLPLLVPLAAAGAAALWAHRAARVAAAAALAWSIAIAATGAFCYPAELWNSDPSDIDRDHARLWDWRDPQFVRCWRTGLSPQNFGLWPPAR
jgi:hypothetical protein